MNTAIMQPFWEKQSADHPLFEDILWSRPEHRGSAGKLLIVGGSAHGFEAVGSAYSAADSAGAGVVHALLPDVLKKSLGPVFADATFASSTPSGSFSREALAELLTQSTWADAVLLAGDFDRNSETSSLLENYVKTYQGPLTITKDAVDFFYITPELIAKRHKTTLVLSLGQLQKLAVTLKFPTPILLSMGLLLLTQALHELTLQYPIIIVTKELNNLVVAYGGKVSSTKLKLDKEIWRVKTAAVATTYWMQNLSKPYEAITTSVL